MSSFAAQSVTNEEVYLGFWTNWSYGPIRGATLTLTQRDGGLLLAFLALFVTIAGTSFWRIACFTIHYMLSSETSKDGIYHQRQAILRNAANTTSGLWSLVQMQWVWRKHAQGQPYRRILPLVTFTLVIIGAFAVASIFSSRITTSMGNEVLLLGSNCGIHSLDGVDLEYFVGTFTSYMAERITSSANYAQECYGKSAMLQECPTFVQKNLTWTSNHDVGCPFPGQDKICRSNSRNLRLDSGYINSNFDLGVNSPPEDQFLFRSVVECAPINTEGYSENTTIYLEANNTSPRQIMQYYYGRTPSQDQDSQITYQYSTDPVVEFLTYQGINTNADPDYTLSSRGAYIAANGSVMEDVGEFVPIPDLQHPMADVALFLLSANDVIFAEQTDDSWYAAHVPARLKLRHLPIPGEMSVYYRDDPVRVLGCASQYQFCTANLESNIKCTPLTGIFAAQALMESLWQTERQRALSRWSATAILHDASDVTDVVYALGVSSLTARYKRVVGVQARLPDNQWQLEVENWFTATLADLQRMAVEHVTGPIDGNVTQSLRRPQTPEEHLLCRSQKIRSDAFTSFSTLGLLIILSLGGLMISISYTLEFIVHWIQKLRNLGTYKRLEWVTNETLQMQRLAHEECGYGTWMRTAEDYPVTAPGEQLANLDISQPNHPKLESISTTVIMQHDGHDSLSGMAVQHTPTPVSQQHITVPASTSRRRHSF